MTVFILFLIGYFFLTLTLSKIAEREELESDGFVGFLLLIPPLYFLHITKRFSLMLIITVLTYGISNLLVLKGVPVNIALIVFMIPLIIGFIFILYNLKLDLKFSLMNLFPPVLGTFFLLFYLAFYQSEYEKEIKRNTEDENKKYIKNKKFKQTNFFKKKSDFNLLNKNIFKSFENLNYTSLNNEDHFGTD